MQPVRISVISAALTAMLNFVLVDEICIELSANLLGRRAFPDPCIAATPTLLDFALPDVDIYGSAPRADGSLFLLIDLRECMGSCTHSPRGIVQAAIVSVVGTHLGSTDEAKYSLPQTLLNVRGTAYGTDSGPFFGINLRQRVTGYPSRL